MRETSPVLLFTVKSWL